MALAERAGSWDVAEIANSATVEGTAAKAVSGRSLPAAPVCGALMPLTAIPAAPWRALAARAIEPNGYYLPEWELAVDASAQGRMGASALRAWRAAQSIEGGAARLIGLLPVVSLWHAYTIPLPALASAHPYGTLCTPLLDRDLAQDAAQLLLREARQTGAHALILRDVAIEGAAMQAITEALRQGGLRPGVLRSYLRACLDATRDPDDLLREALGARRLKEVRRQRRRLQDNGAVGFEVARRPEDVAGAIERFLALESSGWKGRRGTALALNEGDAAFIRRATVALAASGECEIVSLLSGPEPVAAAIVLRHQNRAFYFKLGIDERFAKYSPGVQLTLELTRHLCADPAIATADSMASADHPMINPIWRGRFAVGDVLIPLKPRDPVVGLIHAALRLRGSARELARLAVRSIPKRGTR